MNRSPNDMRPFFSPRWEKIPHYYGDTVRMIFLSLAGLILIAAPFYAGSLSVEMPFLVAGAVILAVLAGLTNPYNRLIMSANVVAAGVGTIMYGGWALFGYQDNSPIIFVLREAMAFIFLISLYFSLKTLRAMHMHLIGKQPSMNDFNDEEESGQVNFVERLAEESGAESEPEEEALDGLGHPAAPDIDKGD